MTSASSEYFSGRFPRNDSSCFLVSTALLPLRLVLHIACGGFEDDWNGMEAWRGISSLSSPIILDKLEKIPSKESSVYKDFIGACREGGVASPLSLIGLLQDVKKWFDLFHIHCYRKNPSCWCASWVTDLEVEGWLLCCLGHCMALPNACRADALWQLDFRDHVLPNDFQSLPNRLPNTTLSRDGTLWLLLQWGVLSLTAISVIDAVVCDSLTPISNGEGVIPTESVREVMGRDDTYQLRNCSQLPNRLPNPSNDSKSIT